MLGLLKYTDDFSRAQGLNQLWYKDTATTVAKADNNGFTARHSNIIQSRITKGMFYFRIPLNHICCFCEDCDKIVYGLMKGPTLVRKSDDNTIFRAAAAGKVTLDKLSWFVPHVIPTDAEIFFHLQDY